MTRDAAGSPELSADQTGALGGVGILAGLAPRELALLTIECEWRRVSNGEILFNLDRGDHLDGVTFVVEGSVRLARGAGGTGRIFYTDVKAGGQFGEMAALGVAEQGLTVVAREDGLIALLAEQHFLDLLSREESVSRALLCQYAHLLRAREATVPVASGPTEGTGAQRLYGELLALAEPEQAAEGEERLRIARLPRHRELAARVDTTEEAVARAIAEIVREGIASRDYPGLIILDEARLRAKCEPA